MRRDWKAKSIAIISAISIFTGSFSGMPLTVFADEGRFLEELSADVTAGNTESVPGAANTDQAADNAANTDKAQEGNNTQAPAADPSQTENTETTGNNAAEDPKGTTEETKDEVTTDNTGESEKAPDQGNKETGKDTTAKSGEEAPAVPGVEAELTAGDGISYSVTLKAGKEAGIPEGAELKVREFTQKESEGYLKGTYNILKWDDRDVVFYTRYFDLSVVKNGKEIALKAPVNISFSFTDIANDDVEAKNAASLLQVLRFYEKDGTVYGKEIKEKKASSEGTRCDISFETEDFSSIGICGLGEKLLRYRTDSIDATIYGIKGEVSPSVLRRRVNTDEEEGIELVEAYEVNGSKNMWIDISCGPQNNVGDIESLSLYSTRDNKTDEVLSGEFAENESILLPVQDIDGFAVLKDTGLRHRTIEAVPYDGERITVEGMVPVNAELEARDVQHTRAYADSLIAYDITIVNDGHEYKPDDMTKVSVEITNDAIREATEEGRELSLWHISDDGQREEIKDFTVSDNRIIFEAESFSVYEVIDTEDGIVENPRVEFHFISPDYEETLDGGIYTYSAPGYEFTNRQSGRQTSQILKDGESLELITDPQNKGDRDFFGWYQVDPYVTSDTNDYGKSTSDGKIHYTWPEGPGRIRFNRAISITETNVAIGDTVHWSMGGLSGEGTVDEDGNVHVLLAPLFEKYHFVNFMQYARNSGALGASNLMTRKLFVLGSASSLDVKISDVEATSTDSVRLIFKGWEYNTGTEDAPEWTQIDTIDFSGAEIIEPGKDGTYINVSEDVDLYPVFIEARWMDFNVGPTGNGANYVSSGFLLAWEEDGSSAGMSEIEGKSVLSSLEAPVRKGYVFSGWYAGVTDYDPDTGNFTTGTCITETGTSDGRVAILRGTTITGTEDGGKAYEVADGKLKLYNSLSRLTLYAKWTPAQSDITIVYWTENAENDQYFSRSVKTVNTAELNAQLGTNLASGSTVTLEQLSRYKIGGVNILSTDYLDDVGAVPAGEQIFYDLKTRKSGPDDEMFEASKVISGEGTTLFNVYYSRKVFTLVFHIGRDGYVSTSGEQKASNNGSWMQMFYNDNKAKSYDAAEGVIPSGGRGASLTSNVTMSFNGRDYTSEYATTSENVKNDYLPSDDENVYMIRAKYGAYIGDLWPSQSNPDFTFTPTSDRKKEMYTWSAYYESRYCYIANSRTGATAQDNHPDINGIYSYMSAELCSNRDGTEIINENQVHHFVAYFGDYNKAGVRKTYHILYEAIDGTYDPDAVETVPGADYSDYDLTSWAINVAHADQNTLKGRTFYETKEYMVISNLQPKYQLGSDLEGYELVYSCYNTPSTNNHHIYFFYTPRKYTLTFNFENEADRKTDVYYYTQSLAEAKKYDDPERTGHRFMGWYTNEAGSGEPFDFADSTMPAMNLVLYPVLNVLQYTVKIDPNGGQIDHINYDRPGEDYYGICANDYGVNGSGHNRSQATYFTADYGTPVSPYTVSRNYIPLSDNELDPASPTYYSGDRYYYINMQMNPATDGDWGLAPDLRNAVYMTEEQLQNYYDYYKAVVLANEGYYSGVTLLERDEFLEAYTSYPDQAYRPVSSEHYTFMGWYQVYDDGTESSMPYNFNDPVYGEITLRAKWRLDGGYYVQYNPCYYADEDGVITAVVGEIAEWTDPADTSAQLYADQSPTHVMRKPTNVTDGWVFRGWRVVRSNGTKSSVHDGEVIRYTNWEPIEFDDDGKPVYYNPGETFLIDSVLATERRAGGNGAAIHMQAYYEREDSAERRPYVAKAVLDANDEYGGYVNTSDSSLLPEIKGPGRTYINTEDQLSDGKPTQIVFDDIQSNMALHLYRYATEETYNGKKGRQFFENTDSRYRLLGFDENSDPRALSTGKDYIPKYAANAVAAVTRKNAKTLYAVWEPMIYVTFVNTTGADISVSLTGTGGHTVDTINEITGEYKRSQNAGAITVPARSGGKDGRVTVVLPCADPGDTFTATARNAHGRYLLNVSGEYPQGTEYGTGSSGIRFGSNSTYSGDLVLDEEDITVTYTEDPDKLVTFDVNGGVWTETSEDFDDFGEGLFGIYRETIENRPGHDYEPADPTHSERIFLGWTDNADIASHTDFSSTSAVTWGDTKITPDPGSNVLEKIRSDYLWDFSKLPETYDEVLYAVWSDTVTVTYDLMRDATYQHTWTGPDVSPARKYYDFYTSGDTTVSYTVMKGETVPRPMPPTDNRDRSRVFLEWLTTDRYTKSATVASTVSSYMFPFDQPVTEDITVYTSWVSNQVFTFNVKNRMVNPIHADDEFDYTITLEDTELNAGGKYVSPSTAFGAVDTRLKNNETYTVKITVTYIPKEPEVGHGWEGFDAYIEIFDRNGDPVRDGYHIFNNSYGNDTSDYKFTLRVVQSPKPGYETEVSSDETGTSILGFGDDEFTFHSDRGNRYKVGGKNTNPFAGGERNYKDITVTFTNTGGIAFVAPTGLSANYHPFLMLFAAAAALSAVSVIWKRRREEED